MVLGIHSLIVWGYLFCAAGRAEGKSGVPWSMVNVIRTSYWDANIPLITWLPEGPNPKHLGVFRFCPN